MSATRRVIVVVGVVLVCSLLGAVAAHAAGLGVLVAAGSIGVGLGPNVGGFRSAVVASAGGTDSQVGGRPKLDVTLAFTGWFLIVVAVVLFYVVVAPSLTK